MSEEKLIVISTHILEEVEAVCTRAIIIASGKILADDSPENLAASSRYHNAVRLHISNDANFDEVRAAIEGLPSVAKTESDREHLRITAIASNVNRDVAAWRDVSC